MFHLIPSKIAMETLRQENLLETLNPPYDLRVKKYPMKVAVRTNDQKRYIRKVATTFQCARIIGKPKTMPCNGALYFVDKVGFYLRKSLKYMILGRSEKRECICITYHGSGGNWWYYPTPSEGWGRGNVPISFSFNVTVHFSSLSRKMNSNEGQFIERPDRLISPKL